MGDKYTYSLYKDSVTTCPVALIVYKTGVFHNGERVGKITVEIAHGNNSRQLSLFFFLSIVCLSKDSYQQGYQEQTTRCRLELLHLIGEGKGAAKLPSLRVFEMQSSLFFLLAFLFCLKIRNKVPTIIHYSMEKKKKGYTGYFFECVHEENLRTRITHHLVAEFVFAGAGEGDLDRTRLGPYRSIKDKRLILFSRVGTDCCWVWIDEAVVTEDSSSLEDSPLVLDLE